jgi:hypothetical protein
MAAPNNLTTTLNNIGNREDLSDMIHRVAPEKTPFISAIGRGRARARYHEWQTETLRAASDTNAVLEGDDVSGLNAPNLTTRLGNYCQIMDETGGVSRTQEIVEKAGRASEMRRQKILKGIELRRDMEARFCGNLASRAESGANARLAAGVQAFLTTNVDRGVGGANGGFSAGIVAAATNGTLRQLTEDQVTQVQAERFAESGAVEGAVAFMSGPLKQRFARFTGIADIRKDAGSGRATIVGGADVYVSDFGDIRLVPHPYAFSRAVLIADPSMAEVAMLDGYKTEDLAKTGDNERFLITVEAALVVKNEKAHGIVADVQPT